MKFPKPWKLIRTGNDDFIVLDANNRKLFYVVADEGDGDEAEPSALHYSDDDDDDALLLEEIKRLFEVPWEVRDDPYQLWIDEVQTITCNFVQDDQHLGELMLDRSEYYWNKCFSDGLTPQQALDQYVRLLKGEPIS